MKNIIILLALLASINTTFAISYTWNGTTSTNWNTATNWTPAGVPTTADNITIVTGSNNCLLAANTTVTNLTLTSGTLNLNGFTLNTTGAVACNAGTCSNGTFNSTATTLTFAGTVFTANVTANATTVNFNGGTFSNPVTITGVDITVRTATFNATTTFTKTGGVDNYGTSGTAIFNAPLAINQQSNTGYFMLGFNSVASFNDNITVTCTGTAGINLGYTYGTGSPTLAAGKTILIGGAGFTSGYLRLGGFTQLGTTPLNLTLTGSAGVIVSATSTPSTFAAPVTIIAPDITIAGGTFNGATTFTKTAGASNHNGGVQNIFNAPLFINQQSNTGYFMLGYNSNDLFNDDITLTSTGTGGINLGWVNGSSGTPTLAAGKTVSVGGAGFSVGNLRFGGFTQLGTTPINLALTGTASLSVNTTAGPCVFGGAFNVISPDITIAGGTFNGATTFTKTGGTSNHNNGVQNIFNSTLAINQQSSTGYFMLGYNSNDLFNDDITVTSTGTGGIQLGYSGGTGTPTLAVGKTVLIGGAGFSIGYLRFGGFIQLGTTPISLTLTGTAGLYVNTTAAPSVFGGAFSATAPDITIAGGTFNGTTTFTKTGGVGNHNSGVQNIFNAPLFINQQSNTGYFMLGYNSNDLFNDDITVTSTGTAAIQLGWTSGSGTPTLAAGKTIFVGGAGFSTGALYFGGFTQLGTIPINLALTGTTTSLQFRASTFGGTFTATSPTYAIFGSTFNGIDFTKTGASGDCTSGSNTFNGTSLITNTSVTYFGFGCNTPDVWNGDVTFTNTGTERIVPAWGSAGNMFNGNITLNTTGTGQGIDFGGGGGTATLAATKTISVGGLGYNAGYLKLQRFTQLGNVPVTLNFATTAGYLHFGPVSTIGGDLVSNTPGLYFNGCTFNGTVNATKTGTTSDWGQGGNVFNGVTNITNAGTGYLLIGGNNADAFNDVTTFNNTGGSSFYFAYNHTGQTTTFATDLTLNSAKTSGSSTSFYGAEGSNASYTVGGNFTLNTSGAIISSSRFGAAVGGTQVYNGDVTINSTNSHSSTQVNMGISGTSTYNGNIVVTNTAGGIGSGVWFNNSATATSTLAATKTISLGAGGFISGDLSLARFIQLGATPQTLVQTTGTARLILGPTSRFDGDVNFNFPQVYLHGTTYNGLATIEKNGASGNWGNGGNVFNGTTVITNSGTGYLLTGGNNADAFNGITTFNNTSTDRFYFAYQHTGQTTTFAQAATLNANKNAGTDGWAYMVSEGTNSNVRFDGALNINIGGTVVSNFRVLNGSGTTAGYNGDVAINVTNTHASTSIQMGLNGTSAYNGNISVANTGGASGVFFNLSTSATSTLNNKAISLGAGGFTAGTLSLLRFTQLGNVPQIMLQTTGTAQIILGPTSRFDGDVNFSFPQVYLNGTTYNGLATIEKNGATNNPGSGGNIFNGTTIINNSGTGYLLTGNTTADAFNDVTTFNNTGSHNIYFAHNHTGQTTTFAQATTLNSVKTGAVSNESFLISEGANSNVRFDGPLTINIGSAFRSELRTVNSTTATATYNGDVAINLANTNTATPIYMGTNGTSIYNGNISVASTGGASGVYFNNNATATSMLNNKAISLGAGGFTAGTLSLLRFTQLGNVPQTMLQTTGTAQIILGPTSRFDGDVNFNFPQVYLNGTTYNGSATIEKNGATNNSGLGGNIFNGTTIINNSSIAYLLTGNTTADAFNGVTTFNNTGSHNIYFAHNHAGQTTTFAQATILNSVKTGAVSNESFLISEGANSNVRFDGPLTINIGSAFRSELRTVNSTTATATYNGDVAINLANTNTITSIFMGTNGTSIYNGNISVASTGGASGVYFNNNASATSTLNNKAISLGTGGFTAGTLSIIRFTQLGAGIPQTMLQTTGTARVNLGPTSRFDGDVNFSFPQMYLNGTTYNGLVTLQKNGASDNYANGGNIFNGTTIINNSGTGYLLTGGTNADAFNGITTFNNTGTHSIYFAHNHTGQTTIFAQATTLNAVKTGNASNLSYLISENNNSNVRFDGTLTLNIGGTFRSDVNILNGTTATATYNNDVAVNLTNTQATTAYMGLNGTSTYNGNISVTNTGGANGVYFNTNASSTSILAATKAISTGGAGFTAGILSLPRFTQLGTATNTLTLGGTVTNLYFGPTSVFGGGITSTSPRVLFTNSTFNGTVNSIKTGATVDNTSGGNIFNGALLLTNNGTGSISMGNTVDAYNNDVTYTQNNTGILYPNHSANSTYAGNITVGSTGTYAITFGQTASGIATLTGGNAQTINKTGTAPNPTFTRLVVNKLGADVTLNTRTNISSYITLTQGIINTTATNILNMNDNTTTSIGNTLSYVNGPMNYDMALNATARTLNFPIGKAANWRPAKLTAKHNASTSYTYTAEVFNANAWNLGYVNPPTVSHVSSRRYWDINRSVTSTGVAAPLTNVSGNQIVQLYYGVSDSVTDPANVTICKNTSTTLTTWIDIGGTGASVGTGSVTSTSAPSAFNSFSRFTLGNKWGGTNPLPVELLYFEAKAINQKVNIAWATASETNNRGFEIEKSTDGINFELLRFVPAQGNGNATYEQNYTTIDEKPYDGVSYYRLKQIDYNGAYEYSNLEAVEFNKNSYINFYPNPAVNTLLVKASEDYTNATIKIINALGVEVKLAVPLHLYNGSIDVSNLATGFYVVMVQNNTTTETFKISILK